MLLLILGQRVQIDSDDNALRQIFAANFGAMAVADRGEPRDLHYLVRGRLQSMAFSVTRNGIPCCAVEGLADLMFALEGDIVIELQHRHPHLYFLHAAAIAHNGRAYLLVAESGQGKSTTTWGLLHHGFSYLSDELSPVDLDRLQVLAYPHALCLKKAPPEPYSLPSGAIGLGRTIHVPVRSLPGPWLREPVKIGAVFLIRYDPDLAAPQVRTLSAAEAAVRIYVNALNALAHPHRGLDAALHIAASTPCFALATADLTQTCALILATADDLRECTSRAPLNSGLLSQAEHDLSDAV